MTKQCSACGEQKALAAFHRRKSAKDGRMSLCKACRVEGSRVHYEANREAVREYQGAYYQANKESLVASSSANYYAKRECVARRKRAHYYANREARLEANRAYYEKNVARFLASNARRKAAKSQRTPRWADLDAIAAVYEYCPRGYHVDHIIPLRGKNVSGLHVAKNLQYLTASANLAKGNR